MNESFLCSLVRFSGAIFSRLPYGFNMAFGRAAGALGHCLMSKKREVVHGNLRTAFPEKDLKEIRSITKQVFKNFACNFMDLLCLSKIKNETFKKMVIFEGRENIEEALKAGKGCVLLAVHSGSWELASLVNGMCDHPYNIVANEQKKAPKLNELLNEYRRLAGAKVIAPGSATRDIVRALRNNEMVCLVLDQGGSDGTPVEFFGKTASMSTGAIRLALKYQTSICPGWICRQENGQQLIKFLPPVVLTPSGDEQKDILEYTQKFARYYEDLLREHPQEYMWFYKVFKYTTQADIMLLDDGKTGHLRQSQALFESLKTALQSTNKTPRMTTIKVEFKSRLCRKIFSVYCFFAQVLIFLRKPEALKHFVKEDCYQKLVSFKPDYIISCGSQTAGVSFILSYLSSIKTIHSLKPGSLSWRAFSLVVVPEHDRPKISDSKSFVTTKAALNLITPQYLKQQEERLFLRYPQLKTNTRSKIGVLLGGDTKGVSFDLEQITFLINKLKESALRYNIDLLVTTSRRTPPGIDQMIVNKLRTFEKCPLLVIANEINIPEAVGGILALSDVLIVSGESISMVSEAVSSGKKTIAFASQGEYSKSTLNKYDEFVMGLSAQGYLLATSIKDISSAINQVMNQKVTNTTLDDNLRVIEAIKGLL